MAVELVDCGSWILTTVPQVDDTKCGSQAGRGEARGVGRVGSSRSASPVLTFSLWLIFLLIIIMLFKVPRPLEG